jgi:hypothetical protein
MDPRGYRETPNEKQGGNDQGGAAGLMALVVLLIFMVCTAASLLLTLPQTFDGATTAAASTRQVTGSPSEQTFHERYPSSAPAESVDVPTF